MLSSFLKMSFFRQVWTFDDELAKAFKQKKVMRPRKYLATAKAPFGQYSK